MKTFSKKWWQYELKSFITTFLSVLAVDGLMELIALYNGDLSISTFQALGVAVLRSVVKTLIQLAFPSAVKDVTR